MHTKLTGAKKCTVKNHQLNNSTEFSTNIFAIVVGLVWLRLLAHLCSSLVEVAQLSNSLWYFRAHKTRVQIIFYASRARDYVPVHK